MEREPRIAGTVTEPRINGRADLIRGSYDFAGRRFDLSRGSIRFLGESPVNPVLDITAEGGVRGLNAVIRVTGRGQKPEIAFTSSPALPQDELLSRLLFGTSITNLSAPEALQLAAAVASLNNTAAGLDPINAVRAATGLDRLRIVPRIIHVEFDREGRRFPAHHFFPLQLDVGVDLVVAEHVALGQEGAVVVSAISASRSEPQTVGTLTSSCGGRS
jgi:hypothetical protein